MLDWVTGASRSQRDEYIEAEDMPETPAHVFAARAFKSLLFGTPAHNDMTVEKPKRPKPLVSATRAMRRHSTDVISEQPGRPLMRPRHSDPMASPSKGILVPPGSTSTKRKSVTFGGLHRDSCDEEEEDNEEDAGTNTQVNSKPPTMDISPVQSVESPQARPIVNQEDLRRSLFSKRHDSHASQSSEGTDRREDTRVVEDTGNHCIVFDAHLSEKKPMVNLLPAKKLPMQVDEQTIDLNQPRSTSGQHWKREYERDHDASKAEMKKLIQYNQMTKSFAEKRDRDAVIMTQKLNQAEAKAKSLERKIQKLTSQLMDSETHGEEQESILGEVAAQTAEVMRYNRRADKYRAALRKHEAQSIDSQTGKDEMETSTQARNESLLEELETVKTMAEDAEARAATAEQHNASLLEQLAKLKDRGVAQERRYDELQARRRKQELSLLEDNQRLNEELRAAQGDVNTLQEQLRTLRVATRVIADRGHKDTKDRLFDLSHTRMTKETTPPTSDEELRLKAITTPHRTDSLPNMDFTFVKESGKTSGHQLDNRRRKSHAGESSDSFTVPEMVLSTPQVKSARQPQQQAVVPTANNPKSIFDSRGQEVDRPLYDATPTRNSSPLMKSFVDNLGSRRAIPPERIAAAKKRLEEKAANRRATPGYGQLRQKAVV